MTALYLPLVRRLVETIVVDANPAMREEATLATAGQMLLGKVLAMPRYLGLPMFVLLTVFEVYAIALCGLPFRWAGAAGRARVVRHWRSHPVGPFRDFGQFYEKMGTFLYYSLIEEREAAHGH